jgi:hypothetical protein
MRTLALLLILVAKVVLFSKTIAASQPHHWLAVLMAAIARCIGR